MSTTLGAEIRLHVHRTQNIRAQIVFFSLSYC